MRIAIPLAALALLIRAAMLRSRFPYIDDLLQLYAVTRPSATEAARAVSGIGPLQPPLDYLVDFLAARFTGDLTLLRLLPAAWGVASVAAAFDLGSKLRGRAFGAWWAALLAVSLPLASFSVTLRPYSLAVLLALLCWRALVELLDGGEPWPYALGQCLFQIAYPHAWLVAAAQAAYVARFRRPALPRLLRAMIPSVLTLCAWLAWWHLKVATPGGFHYDVPWSALSLIWSSFGQALGHGPLLYSALCAAGLVAAARPGPQRDFVRLAALSLAAPLAAIFAIHRAEHVLLLPRHALPLLPAYLGLAAAGCAAVEERAAVHSKRAGLVARATLAAVVIWTASLPLGALAARESALSAHLGDFAEALRREAGESDVLVFADPNTGATLLHALDRKAFDALNGIRMRAGFALFEFPKTLAVAAGPRRLEAYTLCPLDPALATIDGKLLRKLRAAGQTVRLITLEGLNAAPQPDPFAALGLGEGALIQTRPGLFLLR